MAERKNRHIMEVPRALIFQMSVDKKFWGDAVRTATYLININRMPSSILKGEVPHHAMSYSHINLCILSPYLSLGAHVMFVTFDPIVPNLILRLYDLSSWGIKVRKGTDLFLMVD